MLYVFLTLLVIFVLIVCLHDGFIRLNKVPAEIDN